jgi:hypothetical protein
MLKPLSNHLLQRHVIPYLLIPVVMSGFACWPVFGLPDSVYMASNSDVLGMVIISAGGILGSIGTMFVLCVIRKKEPHWRAFELGRTAWLTLIILAWIAGLGCGWLMVHAISR